MMNTTIGLLALVLAGVCLIVLALLWYLQP
jgi:hypothetical protein